MNDYFAGDLRRAGVAVKYFGTGHVQGFHTIIDEAVGEDRVTELLGAATTLYAALIETLLSEIGQTCVGRQISLWSQGSEDPDVRRACTWICAQAHTDTETMNRVLAEASQPENRIMQLVTNAFAVHDLYLKVATSDPGLVCLDDLINRLILRENGIDPDEGAA